MAVTFLTNEDKVELEAQIAAVGSSSDSGQNVTLSTAQIEALNGMFKVCAFAKADVSVEYTAFQTAFGITDSGGDSGETEKTLTGISATYSGGSVPVGTAVSALTGIVVTAHYSDGTSQAVTGYTLSGTIAEGSNTVTVTYQSKTTTFTVTGVAYEEPESDEYVSDGLYLWLDGIRNTANGHAEELTAWEDLVGGVSFVNYGLTVESDAVAR